MLSEGFCYNRVINMFFKTFITPYYLKILYKSPSQIIFRRTQLIFVQIQSNGNSYNYFPLCNSALVPQSSIESDAPYVWVHSCISQLVVPNNLSPKMFQWKYYHWLQQYKATSKVKSWYVNEIWV